MRRPSEGLLLLGGGLEAEVEGGGCAVVGG